MNEFESDWISLSQSQNGVKSVFQWIKREDNKVSESKIFRVMAVSESNMAEFKMAAIIKLVRLNYFESQTEWRVFFSESESDNKVLNPSESNMAEFKKPSSSWVRIQVKIEFFFVQNGWIQDGRIQDGCHHQVEWEWMSLSQIELVWVRVLCKMAESKMAELKMEELKMVAIIKLIRWN